MTGPAPKSGSRSPSRDVGASTGLSASPEKKRRMVRGDRSSISEPTLEGQQAPSKAVVEQVRGSGDGGPGAALVMTPSGSRVGRFGAAPMTAQSGSGGGGPRAALMMAPSGSRGGRHSGGRPSESPVMVPSGSDGGGSGAVPVMAPSDSSGGGPDAALAGAEKAPEVTPDPKPVAKRTTIAMGSSGSSHPRKRFRAT
jgi:hypothetical protein